MNHILGFGISILSTIIGITIMVGGYILYGKAGMSEGAGGWLLVTLGAPTTFFGLILHKIGLLSGSIIFQYVRIFCFYLIQYQIIALLVYKGVIDITKKSGVIYLIIIFFIILISAKIMWNIIGLAGPSGMEYWWRFWR